MSARGQSPRSRSPVPMDEYRSKSRSASRSPRARRDRHLSRSRSRSLSRSRSRSRSDVAPASYRNGRHRDSRSRSYSRDRESRSRSATPITSTKIVVERLTKNITEEHLRQIFGEYGVIRDLDLPLNRQFGYNRGTAYILYVNEADAESAISNMHEAKLDGVLINVSVVLSRQQWSSTPPQTRRGNPAFARNQPLPPRPNGPGAPRGGAGGVGGRFQHPPPGPPRGGGRFGPRSDVWRPRSLSRSRSRSPDYRSQSPYSNRERSSSQGYGGTRRHSPARDDRRRSATRDDRRRSPSRSSYGRRSRSRSRSRSPRRNDHGRNHRGYR